MKTVINTPDAPQAIGAYSQAARAGDFVYISGQIPLLPAGGEPLQEQDAAIRQVFSNMAAIAKAAGGNMDNIVKLSVYLTDLTWFARVNEVMAEYFSEPYPARATMGVASLPKGAQVEAEAVLYLPQGR